MSYHAIREYDHKGTSPFSNSYREVLGKIRRARSVGQLKRHISPSQFIGWAREHNISLQGKFLEEYKSRFSAEPEKTGVSKTTLHKLVLVFAIAHHGYDPTMPFDGISQPNVCSGILTDLTNVGCKMDDATIKKALEEAWKSRENEPDSPVKKKAYWKTVRMRADRAKTSK